MKKSTFQVAKVTKKPFIAKIAAKKGCDIKEATEIYQLFINTLIEEILTGNEVVLTGFGSFSAKIHRGHEVIFGGNKHMDDYITLKFKVAHTFKERLRDPNSKLLERLRKAEAANQQ